MSKQLNIAYDIMDTDEKKNTIIILRGGKNYENDIRTGSQAAPSA